MINLIFNIADLTNTPLDKRCSVKLTPLCSPLVTGSTLIVEDYVIEKLENGIARFENLVAQNYSVEIKGENTLTTWSLNVPTSSYGDVNAVDLLYPRLPGCNPFISISDSSSYALSASYAKSASYSRSGSYSLFAVNAINAQSSDYSLLAGEAIHTNTAQSADYALLAGQALTAAFANNAATAITAQNANYATFAAEATSASYSEWSNNVWFERVHFGNIKKIFVDSNGTKSIS